MNDQFPGFKDPVHRAADGRLLDRLIEGVCVRDRPAIVTRNGVTTELFSAGWAMPTAAMQHAIYVTLKPMAISAWHRHEAQTDHIAVVEGMIKLVLFDPRSESATRGQVDVLFLGAARPNLVAVPPGLWHGVANMLPHACSSFVNLFDRPYRHENPDEWRLPIDNDVIPYRFEHE